MRPRTTGPAAPLPRGRDYLTARGVPGDLADRLGLGYAPDRWRGLTDHLLRHRVSEERAVAAGLAMPTARNVCDKLRGRVVFPARDETGHLVGFTGRAAPGSSPNAPKYLDTLARGGKSRLCTGWPTGWRAWPAAQRPSSSKGHWTASP